MDEDKILFKFSDNTSLDGFVEQNKTMHSKRYLIYQIILSFILIITFLSFTFSEMNDYHVSFKFAASEYFTNVSYLIINFVIIVSIFKIAYIDSWLKIMFEFIRRGKNIPNAYGYICFYESKVILFTEIDSKIYLKTHIDYSSFNEYIITDNLILLKSNIYKFGMPKDSCELGNIDDFIKFIQTKVKN